MLFLKVSPHLPLPRVSRKSFRDLDAVAGPHNFRENLGAILKKNGAGQFSKNFELRFDGKLGLRLLIK